MRAKFILNNENNLNLTFNKEYNVSYLKEGWLSVKDDTGQEIQVLEKYFERYEYSPTEAALKALHWCDEHPGWKRVCDIDNIEQFYTTWADLSEEEKRVWIRSYGKNAELFWNETGPKPCKIPMGAVSGKGIFYINYPNTPFRHSKMLVYKVG